MLTGYVLEVNSSRECTLEPTSTKDELQRFQFSERMESANIQGWTLGGFVLKEDGF